MRTSLASSSAGTPAAVVGTRWGGNECAPPWSVARQPTIVTAITVQERNLAMGFFKRHRDEPSEVPCPSCQVLVAADALECDVCGHDLREPAPGRDAEPARSGERD